MSSRSPQSPIFSRKGFQPLDNSNNMNFENDIPLTTVGSASSTGARRAGDQTFHQQSTFKDDEKKGLFNRGIGGRRKVKKITSKPTRIGTDGEEISVNGMGRFYSKVVNFSVVTRYVVYVAPVALLIAAPIIIYAILDPTAIFASTGIRVIWFWTWIETIWLSIWASKLVAKAVPWMFMFLCGVVSSGTRKYAMILKAVEIPLSLVGWAVTVLVTFTALTEPNINEGIPSKHWVSVVRHLLGPCLIAALLFLGEKVIIQLISVGYHRRSFDARIKQSKRDVHLIGLLYEASRTLFPMYCQEFLEEDYIINDSIEAILAKTTGRMGHQSSGSATPLKLIGEVGRLGDKVTSVFGNIASEIIGKQVFNPNSPHNVVVEALEKTSSSEALAKRLWMSFVVEGKEALYVEDVQEVLGPTRKEEADEAFSALDQDGNGDISLDEMIMKIVDIGRDRKSISHSMRDVGQAIGVLDQILLTVLSVIIIFIFVAFQDTNFVTTLATAGTTLLSLSFVFAATTQEFLGSCIFIFIKHVYDCGDRVDIVGPSQEECLVVEQISLLYTVFKRIDSMKMVQVPNIVLNTLWIENITRSKAMKEQLEVFTSFDTSLEDIELLRKEMENFVRQSDNSRDFQPDIILEATGIGSMDRLQLKVEIRHKSNWHNETVRAARRSKFMCALVLALRKVPIYGPGGGADPLGAPTNPSYSVAVSDSLAAEARDKAAKDKENMRLVPTKPAPKSPFGDLGLTGEEKAAGAMNARSPTADAAHHTSRPTWSSGEDNTLNSRDESLERHRSNEIDNLREGLIKRQSTRGRRRPGDAMPPTPTQGGPGIMLTSASPNREGFMTSMSQTLDEEAELGVQSSTSSPGYTTYSGQNQAYNIYPSPSAGSRGAQLQQPVTGQASVPSQGRLKRLSLGLKPSNDTSGPDRDQ